MNDREMELDTVRRDGEMIAYVLRHAASLPPEERGPMRALTRRIIDQTARRMVARGVAPGEARQLAMMVLGAFVCFPVARKFTVDD